MDGRDDGGAPDVADQRLPGRVAGLERPLARGRAQPADQPGPDLAAVLEQEERDERGQDQAGEHLDEVPASGDDRAGDHRLVLGQVVEQLAGELVEPDPPEPERRPGQVGLHLVDGPPDLGRQLRVVRLDPVGDQRPRAGQHGDRGQQGAPGRGQGRQADPLQERLQRLEQGGQQQRGDQRQDDQTERIGDLERQVDDGRHEQQPPRPGRGVPSRPGTAASARRAALPASAGQPRWQALGCSGAPMARASPFSGAASRQPADPRSADPAAAASPAPWPAPVASRAPGGAQPRCQPARRSPN